MSPAAHRVYNNTRYSSRSSVILFTSRMISSLYSCPICTSIL
nr:MAG TPA: hypothetical protein [Caudoviricetes sp.]